MQYAWLHKVLGTFFAAGLIDERTQKKFSAVAISYYKDGFKGILEYEIKQYKAKKVKSADKAYSNAFKSLRDILEHKIP